jgi:hypothetical protein
MNRREAVRANVARWRERKAESGYIRIDVYLPGDVIELMAKRRIDTPQELATRLSRHFRNGGGL